jgi:hypothetical protein
VVLDNVGSEFIAMKIRYDNNGKPNFEANTFWGCVWISFRDLIHPFITHPAARVIVGTLLLHVLLKLLR